MSAEPARIIVCGSGSYGTAIATVLARNRARVTILARKPDVVDSINVTRRNCRYLSEFELPEGLDATTDAQALFGVCASECTRSGRPLYIVHTVPVQSSFEYITDIAELIPPTAVYILCSKGLHVKQGTFMHELLARALGRPQPVTVLSGPTFARELMLGYPSGAVIGGRDIALARTVASLFTSTVFRPYVSSDLVGIEVAGALKNVYALAAGAVEGIGYGSNTTALLVTRAVAEMNSLASALGSTEPTLTGLAGVGDLMLTCWGSASRNRSVGVRLGRGEPVATILASLTEVAEGVATAPAALALAHNNGLEGRVPIIAAICDVVEGKKTAKEALAFLLAIPIGREHILDGASGIPARRPSDGAGVGAGQGTAQPTGKTHHQQ